jgi:hypothetical protein
MYLNIWIFINVNTYICIYILQTCIHILKYTYNRYRETFPAGLKHVCKPSYPPWWPRYFLAFCFFIPLSRVLICICIYIYICIHLPPLMTEVFSCFLFFHSFPEFCYLFIYIYIYMYIHIFIYLHIFVFLLLILFVHFYFISIYFSLIFLPYYSKIYIIVKSNY